MMSYTSNTLSGSLRCFQNGVKGTVIWNFFSLPQPINSTATCNTCAVNVPRGGGKTSSYDTTNLIKHLRRFHAREHAEFIELYKQKGGGMKQLTLKEMKERGEKFPPSSVQATKITERGY